MWQLSKQGIQGLIGGEGGWVPSRLRKEMGGISLLPTDITRRRPSGGEGSSRRFLAGAPEAEEGRAAGDEGASPPLATGSAAEAKVAWCRAALALALAFFVGPR